MLWPLVRDATLDFAVGLRPDLQHEPALRFRPLARMGFAIVGRRGHPLRKAGSLAQLTEADWLTLLPPEGSGSALDRIFAAARLPAPCPLIQCNSHATMFALLAQSDMLGTLSRWMLAQPAVHDVLEEIEVAEAIPSYAVGIITRAEPPLTPVVAALARELSAAVRAQRSLQV